MIYLQSVDSFYEPETDMIYPSEFNGVTEVPVIEMGMEFSDVSIEFIENLSDTDISSMIHIGFDPYTE